MRDRLRRAVPCLVALCAPLASAHAQSIAGPWQAGATTVDVVVGSWGADCGPRPQSMRAGGGGSVQVDQQGDRLIVRGKDRTLYSDRCGSPNPALRRVSTGRVQNTWTTRCRTEKLDPRQESATYTLELVAPDRLQYRDVSHFNWKLKQSTCAATITTTQVLERKPTPALPPQPVATGAATALVPGTAAVPPGATPPGAAAQACTPGPAARVSLRPAKLELELGQRACFEAEVLDARGCALPGAEPRLALDHGPGIRAQLEGRCFRAADSSAEGEGSFRVVARFKSLRDEAQVRVSAEALPSLIAARALGNAITGEVPEQAAAAGAPAGGSPELATEPVAQPASRLAARAAPAEESDGRRMLLLGLALVLVLAAVGFVLRRERLSRVPDAPRRPEPDAEAPSAKSAPRVLRCPTCGTRYPEGNVFCGEDGSALLPDT